MGYRSPSRRIGLVNAGDMIEDIKGQAARVIYAVTNVTEAINWVEHTDPR